MRILNERMMGMSIMKTATLTFGMIDGSPWRWKVYDVDEEEGTMCLISEYTIRELRYTELETILESVLNDSFTEFEKIFMLPVSSTTEQKMKVLSKDEVEQFFSKEEDRICCSTPFAVKQGNSRRNYLRLPEDQLYYTQEEYERDAKKAASWWLSNTDKPYFVCSNGKIYDDSPWSLNGFRPCIKVRYRWTWFDAASYQ